MPNFTRFFLPLALATCLASCGTPKTASRHRASSVPARTNVLPSQPVPASNAVAIFSSIRVKQDMIPPHKVGRHLVRPMNPRFITIHATENYSPSADAAQHALALKRGSLRGRNSLGYLTWHFTVDDNKAVQHLPLNERGEHADFDGPGNRYSIGIEMCENKGSNRQLTVDRAARLAGILMRTYDIPLANVVPHYHWPRLKYKDKPHKNCPHFLMDNGRPGKTWNYFLARVNHYANLAGTDAAGVECPRPQALQAYFERGSMVRRSLLAGAPASRRPLQ